MVNAGVLESLASSGVSGGGFVLSWPETRLFVQYLQLKRYEPRNARNLLGYLDRLVKQPIRAPVNVMQLFSPLTTGQRHHLNRALRAWFNCLEINRSEKEFKDFLDALRRAFIAVQLDCSEARSRPTTAT